MIYLPWKSIFSLRFALLLLKDQTKMGNFEVRKSDLSKRLDGRINLNFSMIHRNSLLRPVSFMSLPARFNESHRPQAPEAWWKGASYR